MATSDSLFIVPPGVCTLPSQVDRSCSGREYVRLSLGGARDEADTAVTPHVAVRAMPDHQE